LLNAPHCIINPHIAWATKEARERIMQITADNVRSFIEGHPQNVVNR
jgi:glycerate dehydrogenase